MTPASAATRPAIDCQCQAEAAGSEAVLVLAASMCEKGLPRLLCALLASKICRRDDGQGRPAEARQEERAGTLRKGSACSADDVLRRKQHTRNGPRLDGCLRSVRLLGGCVSSRVTVAVTWGICWHSPPERICCSTPPIACQPTLLTGTPRGLPSHASMIARIALATLALCALSLAEDSTRISVGPTTFTVEEGFKQIVTFELHKPIICESSRAPRPLPAAGQPTAHGRRLADSRRCPLAPLLPRILRPFRRRTRGGHATRLSLCGLSHPFPHGATPRSRAS